MKIYIQVKMKAEFIYDLLLFHTYSKLSGFLINLLGLSVIMAGGFLLKKGEINITQSLLYLTGGLFILCFTPINLRLQAKKMMSQSRYSYQIMYGFHKDGIEESIGKTINSYSWENVEKVISTPKDIAFYIKETSALVLPKESFGDEFIPVMNLIIHNIRRDRIFIRGLNILSNQ